MGGGFIFGANAQCPKCGEHQFTWDGELHSDSRVTCDKCDYVTTVEEAEKAGSTPPQAGGSENIVNKKLLG